MRRTLRPAAAALLVGALAAGCGPSVGRPAGKVTLGGQAVAGAELKFVAAHDAKLEFFGHSRDDGTYAVSFREYSGLPVGTYRVTITRYTLPKGQPLPAGEAGSALKASGKAVKRAYAFDKEIKSGSNSIDFDLAQGQPAPAD